MTDAPLVPPVPALSPVAILLQRRAQAQAILDAGTKDLRLRDRSVTYDLKSLRDTRSEIDAQLAALGIDPVTGLPAVARNTRRLLMVQFSKGL